MQHSESNYTKLIIGFMAINFAILVGARVISYYGTPSNPTDLFFSIITAINFLFICFFYTWITKLEGMYREVHLSKQNLQLMEKALHIMREERHDFINHLQAAYGLMCSGNNMEAANYIKILGMQCKLNNQLLSIQNPYLRTLLLNKNNELAKKDIDLDIKIKSKLKHLDIAPLSITTIFGNLIDNARDALATVDEGHPKKITFEAYEFEDKYCFVISDTALQIGSDIVNRIFERGFSTKGENRGYGLALVKDELYKYRGKISYDPETKSFSVIIPFSPTGD